MNLSILICGWIVISAPKMQKDSSLIAIRNYLASTIERNLPPPPDLDSAKTCFYTQQLLKIEVKNSKTISVLVSDTAPDWLEFEIRKQVKNQVIDFQKLDILIKKIGMVKGNIIMPFVIQSEPKNCHLNQVDAVLNTEIFKFKGRFILGNVIFCEGLKFIVSTKLYYSSD